MKYLYYIKVIFQFSVFEISVCPISSFPLDMRMKGHIMVSPENEIIISVNYFCKPGIRYCSCSTALISCKHSVYFFLIGCYADVLYDFDLS